MALLALFVLAQTIGKIFYPSLPIAETITNIGALALGVNILCLILLTHHKGTSPSMRSSWICSRNDVIGNVSVIAAGFLVALTHSMWPDIIVSLVMSGIVLRSAYTIMFTTATKVENDTCCSTTQSKDHSI
jgi:Co/Zn/Cd efflux system component